MAFIYRFDRINTGLLTCCFSDLFILQDLATPVQMLNETALRWIEIAFANNLSLPLENVVTQKVGVSQLLMK